MCQARIRSLGQLHHLILSFVRSDGDCILERFVETSRVRERSGRANRAEHITQVVHRHAGDDDEDILLAQFRYRAAQLVVLFRVLGAEQ